jgi:hypothetical protein
MDGGGGDGVVGTGSDENPLGFRPSSGRREGSEVKDVPVEKEVEVGESIEEAEKEDALEALRS